MFVLIPCWKLHVLSWLTYGSGTLNLKIKGRKNWCVIAGLIPTTRRTQDTAGMRCRRDISGGPDMIQTPTFVGGIPILGPIGPPAIQQPLGNILPRDVNPLACT